jgi:hypothetical protein
MPPTRSWTAKEGFGFQDQGFKHCGSCGTRGGLCYKPKCLGLQRRGKSLNDGGDDAAANIQTCT